MFAILLRKELLAHIKTFRFGAALITTFVLVVLSVWVLGDDFLRRRNLHNKLSENYAQSLREVLVPSQVLPVVQRPPSPLGIFAKGEEGHLGNAVTIRRWAVPDAADNNLTNNILLSTMPTIDMTTILIVAMSLFGVLLSYDAISGERERGTLKQLCACRLKRGVLFSVKFLAGAIVLSIPFLFSLLCGLLVLHLVHHVSFTAEQWLAVALMFAAAFLYGAFFIVLGLVSSAIAARSSTSLALALLFWTVLVVLVPSLSQSLTPAFVALQPPEEISGLAQTTAHEVRQMQLNFIRDNNLDLSSHGDSNIGSESPFWFDGNPDWFRDHIKFIAFYEPLYQARAGRIWDVVNRHNARKRDQLEAARLIGAISPAVHLRKALSALAATDYAAFDAFMDQCRRYRQTLLDDFREKGLFDKNIHRFFTRRSLSEMQTVEQAQNRVRERARRYQAGESRFSVYGTAAFPPLPEDFAPPFQYRSEVPRFEDALFPMGSIAFLSALVFAIGLVAFLRYDIR